MHFAFYVVRNSGFQYQQADKIFHTFHILIVYIVSSEFWRVQKEICLTNPSFSVMLLLWISFWDKCAKIRYHSKYKSKINVSY
jgi:hypothetical protein